MKVKLPTINVTGCHDCPFVTYEDECFFQVIYNGDYDNVKKDIYQESFPEWCPGLKYDLAVEFPSE